MSSSLFGLNARNRLASGERRRPHIFSNGRDIPTMFSKISLRYEPIPLPDRSNLTDREMAQAAGAFYNKIRQRHTVRSYSHRAVPREIIEDCVRSA